MRFASTQTKTDKFCLSVFYSSRKAWCAISPSQIVILFSLLFAKPNAVKNPKAACPIVILFSLLFGEAKRSEESQTKRDFSFRIRSIQNDKAFQLSFFIMLSPVAALWYKT